MHTWSLRPPHTLSPAKPKSLTSFFTFFRSSSLRSRSFFPECLNALRQGFHRSQASSSSMRCRGADSSAEVHVQSYRHPRCTRLEVHLLVFALFDLRITPVCLECSLEFGIPSLTISLGPQCLFPVPGNIDPLSSRSSIVPHPRTGQLVLVFQR